LILEGVHTVSVATKMISGLRIAIKNRLKISVKNERKGFRTKIKKTKKRARGSL